MSTSIPSESVSDSLELKQISEIIIKNCCIRMSCLVIKLQRVHEEKET